MSTDLVPAAPHVQSAAIGQWDPGFQKLVMQTVLKPKNRDATGAELALFAEQCVRTGLSPFLKQIYGIYRYDSRVGGEVMTIQVGIDGLRSVAASSGEYDGQTPPEWCGPDGKWTDVWLSTDPPAAARIGVYRKGATHPTYAVALYREYVQTKNGAPTGKWKDMPANQLVKCAEALALRKSHPHLLSGLTIGEEYEQVKNTDPAGSAEAHAAIDAPAEEITAEPVTDDEPDGRAEALVERLRSGAPDSRAEALVERARKLVDAKVVTGRKLVNALVAGGAENGSTVGAAIVTHPDPDAVEHLLADYESAEVSA